MRWINQRKLLQFVKLESTKMLEVVETCAGSQFENIGLPKLGDRAEQQFSPHYDGSDGNPRLSGPPTPRLGKKGGGRYGNLTPVA